MRKKNAFSIVAEGAIGRVRQIAEDTADLEISAEAKARLDQELAFHEESLKKAFDFRKRHGPKLGMADSDAYFGEKLSAMIFFAKMAFDRGEREGYSPEKINENVSHYSYLVAKLVVADWRGYSKRPISERTIRDTSFENRDAMERLVNK